MSFIRKIFMFLFLLLICEKTYAGKIVMRIFPSDGYSMITGAVEKKNAFSIKATLEGFDFKNNQVTFVPNISENGWEMSCCLNGKIYTPDTLISALQSGEIDYYPIYFHKKLNYLAPDDQLDILQYDGNRRNPIRINLPGGMENRILRYLLNDVEDPNRDCFDFFKEVCEVNSEKEFVIENHEHPGNGFILGDQEDNEDFKAKHYAIVLGDGLCISKLGNGNFIAITDTRTLLDLYPCSTVFYSSSVTVL